VVVLRNSPHFAKVPPIRHSEFAFPNAYSGIGHRDGWIIVEELGLSFNLHRPRTAAALIRRALELGWSSDAPMIVEDESTNVALQRALEFLRKYL